MRRSRHVNLVCTTYAPTWEFPRAGNVLSRDDETAVAVICDQCVRLGREPVRVLEFRPTGQPALGNARRRGVAAEVVYHDVTTLRRIVPDRRCRVCGCTDTAACLVDGVPCSWVEPDLCSACAGSCG